MKRQCGYPGCGRKHYAKDCCWAHYAQLRRGQQLHPLTGRGSEPKDRFDDDGNRLCIDCGLFKPITDFNRNATRFDGFHVYCRSCNRERVAA